MKNNIDTKIIIVLIIIQLKILKKIKKEEKVNKYGFI
jgi:hypothetical protein